MGTHWGGERESEAAWVWPQKRSLRTPAPVAASSLLLKLGIIETTVPKLLFTCIFDLASSSHPEHNRNGGTWKRVIKNLPDERGWSQHWRGSGPRSSQAEHRARPQKEMHLHESHSVCQHTTWWHHFCGELSVQPPFLSPSLSHSLYVSLSLPSGHGH